MALMDNGDGCVSYYHPINGLRYMVIFHYVKRASRSQRPSMRERCPVLDTIRSMAGAIEVFASMSL